MTDVYTNIANNNAEEVIKYLIASSVPGKRTLTPPDLINGLTGANFTVKDSLVLLDGALHKLEVNFEKIDEMIAAAPAELNVYGAKGSDVNEIVSDALGRLDGVDIDFSTSDGRIQYMQKLRNLMGKVEPKAYLMLFNETQKRIPFLLLNHMQNKKTPITYGYGDLFRFICLPYLNGTYERFHKPYIGLKSGLNQMRVWDEKANDGKGAFAVDSEGNYVTTEENPLYNSVDYPIPDMETNKLLMDKMREMQTLYATKFMECRKIVNFLTSKDGKKAKISYNTQLAFIAKVMDNMREIYDKVGNPIWLSTRVSENPRPMAKYNRDHFYSMLRQLTTYKEMDPDFDGQTPHRRTGVSLDVPRIPGAGRMSDTGTSRSRSRKGRGKGKRRRRKSRK